MNSYGLVSIIVPCYNVGAKIKGCVCSILEQEYSDWELIIVNDGSTDDTEEQLKLIQEGDKRIHVYTTRNCGVSAARNYGISVARGDYIAFVDADDVVNTGYISEMVKAINENHADLALCKYSVEDDWTKDLYSTSMLKVEDYVKEMMIPTKNVAAFVWNRLFKSDVIRKNHLRFDDTVKVCEDTLFNYNYMKHIAGIVFVDKPLYHYQINSESAMFGKKFNINRLSANKAYDYMLDDSKMEEYHSSIQVAAMWYNLILKRQIYKGGMRELKGTQEMDIINRMLKLNSGAFYRSEIPAKYKLSLPFWQIV